MSKSSVSVCVLTCVVAASKGQRAEAELLVRAGANVNVVDKTSASPLHRAGVCVCVCVWVCVWCGLCCGCVLCVVAGLLVRAGDMSMLHVRLRQRPSTVWCCDFVCCAVDVFAPFH
jgi:hypothetical protein